MKNSKYLMIIDDGWAINFMVVWLDARLDASINNNAIYGN